MGLLFKWWRFPNPQVPTRNATKSVQTKAGAIAKRFANAPRATWGSTVAPRCVIPSAWTEETAPRPECARAQPATKADIVKEVRVLGNMEQL